MNYNEKVLEAIVSYVASSSQSVKNRFLSWRAVLFNLTLDTSLVSNEFAQSEA